MGKDATRMARQGVPIHESVYSYVDLESADSQKIPK